jgi:hydrogenase maturation protease
VTEDRTPQRRRIVVIGVGNRYRGDDAVGRVVARRLAAVVPGHVEVLEGDGAATELLNAWAGVEAAIVVDAVVSGAPPGTVHRVDAHASPISPRIFGRTTHGLGVAEAVALGRALGELPAHLVVFGIEAGPTGVGEDPSPPVLGAVDEVVRRVRDEIRSLETHAADA